MRSRSAGGRPVCVAPGLALGVGQVAAGAGICPLRGVRRTRCLLDILSAAIAFVQQSAFGKRCDGVVVALGVMRLPLGGLIPREADRREVVELACGDVGVGAVVEIVDPHQEAPAGGTGEQPCQHRGAQVADVQVGRRAGREPARAVGVTPAI